MKPPITSKTILFNVGVLIVALMTAALNVEWVAANPELTLWIGAGIAVVEIILRTITKSALDINMSNFFKRLMS